MNRLFVLALILVSSCGCAQVATQARSNIQPMLTFNRIETLKIGLARADDVRVLLGDPHQATTLKDKSIVWLYLDDDKRIEKAALSFSPVGILMDKWWAVSRSDPERVIQALLKRFERMTFKKQKAIQDFGHFFTSSVYLMDKKQGISIALTQDEKEVASIGWNDSNARAVAENKPQEHKVFHDAGTGLVTKVLAGDLHSAE